ncbi:MAG: hypothetical protein HIU84_05335 [Acidobacteria bacterium]|nr:hypothetical protein [Acidobacteriota bacterium]
MTDNDHGSNEETHASKFSWDPDDVTVLRAGDEDYDDDDEVVGDDDERVDDDDEDIDILDEPDAEEDS